MTVSLLGRAWNWLRQHPFWAALTVISLGALAGLFADDLLAHFDQFSGAYSALAALATTGATFVIAAFSYGTYRLFRIEQARVDALRAEIDMKVRVVHTQVGSFLEVLDDEDEFEGTFDTINPWFSRWNTIAKAKALDSAVGKWMIERLQPGSCTAGVVAAVREARAPRDSDCGRLGSRTVAFRR